MFQKKLFDYVVFIIEWAPLHHHLTRLSKLNGNTEQHVLDVNIRSCFCVVVMFFTIYKQLVVTYICKLFVVNKVPTFRFSVHEVPNLLRKRGPPFYLFW